MATRLLGRTALGAKKKCTLSRRWGSFQCSWAPEGLLRGLSVAGATLQALPLVAFLCTFLTAEGVEFCEIFLVDHRCLFECTVGQFLRIFAGLACRPADMAVALVFSVALLSRDSNPGWGEWRYSLGLWLFGLVALLAIMGNCHVGALCLSREWARCRAALAVFAEFEVMGRWGCRKSHWTRTVGRARKSPFFFFIFPLALLCMCSLNCHG